jgi:hypothetical protein
VDTESKGGARLADNETAEPPTAETAGTERVATSAIQ